MALPSQSARNDGRRSQMFRRTRWPRLPIVLGACALVAGCAWLLIQAAGGEPRAADASPAGAPIANEASRSAAQNSGVGDFGQNRTPRAENTAMNDRLAAVQQQERQRQIEQAGDRLRTAGAEPNPAGARAKATDGGASDQPPAANERPSTGMQPAPGQSPDAPPPSALRNSNTEAAARQQLARGLEMLDADPLAARRLLTVAIESAALPPEDDENVRMALAHLSDRLIFGRTAHPQDSFARTYRVKDGDSLGKIARALDLHVDWRFLLRINGLKDDRALRAGQDLKVITGPFHAVIDKSDYRLDLFLGEGDERIFVRSFRVGLGEYDSTPPGMFRIGVKQEEPTWVNPRDPREKYSADDPKNPLGDHWLALIGIDDATRDFTGYGIHGTIEPDSIGQQQSMGCVRMLPEDVRLIFEVLMTDVSQVEIRN